MLKLSAIIIASSWITGMNMKIIEYASKLRENRRIIWNEVVQASWHGSLAAADLGRIVSLDGRQETVESLGMEY